MDSVDSIFDSYIDNPLFMNKSVLQANYNPDDIVHRSEQIDHIASVLAPALRGEKVSNFFLYGRTGSGKTLSVRYVGEKLLKRAKQSENDYLKFIYVNCKLKKVADTEYRIVAELIKSLGGSVPATGLPTDAVYSRFIEMIDNKKQAVVVVLDEIDQAVKKMSDGFIYSLTRINSELKNAQISLIGISNSLTFMDNLDPRVKSSLGEEELVFPPYNALQLQDILKERAGQAFKEGILDEGVIAKCAAYAAREHGDARRALDLLRVAGELAERKSSKKVGLKFIDDANRKIEKDKMLDVITSVPSQFQLVLWAIMKLDYQREGRRKDSKEMVDDRIFTGEVYNAYRDVCEESKNEVLTQRRVGDIIAEFDMLGVINARVLSKGRHGRTREIKLGLAQEIREKAKGLLKESLGL
jgi:archaeal cell division control protein 6